ncbi:MAG: AroM family protein [Peptococcaceae bacterium]
MKTLGIVVLGQAPRLDFTDEFLSLLPPGIDIVQKGALDGLSTNQILALRPKKEENKLVTMLNDGTSVNLSTMEIHKIVQCKVQELVDTGIEVVFIVCTDNFHISSSKAVILTPFEIMKERLKIESRESTIGIIVPEKDQVQTAVDKWKQTGIKNILAGCASPYKDFTEVLSTANRLKKSGSDKILLDCMGFSKIMADNIKQETGIPVLLPRKICADVVGRYLLP